MQKITQNKPFEKKYKSTRSREEALLRVTVYVTTLYKDTPVKRLTFDIFERWFSNFTIFDRKYVLIFFGKIKTFLKELITFRFVVNPLTLCATLLSNSFGKEQAWFYCLFWSEVRHNVEVSHATLIIWVLLKKTLSVIFYDIETKTIHWNFKRTNSRWKYM